MLAISGARLSAASHQPALKPPLNIPAHDLVGPENRPLIEVRGPATEQRIDRADPECWTFGMLVWRRRVVDSLEQASDGLPGRDRADIGRAVLAVETTDAVSRPAEFHLHPIVEPCVNFE